jgi:hypothetical protein
MHKQVLQTGWECVNYNHVAQDKDKWQAFMNTVMNLQLPQKPAIRSHDLF